MASIEEQLNGETRGRWERSDPGGLFAFVCGRRTFVNEEGKLHGLFFNVVVSALSAIFARGDCIVGDVAVCRHGDVNSVGLTDSDELALRRRLAELGF